jgi:O-methyltransferase involved in polyketide biosynthesis
MMTTRNGHELPRNLLIPLWARAIEQRQPQPIIDDHKSAELVAAIEHDFAQFPIDSSQATYCLRSAIIDLWVRNYLKHYPNGTVVEIGAGLSTRFERVDNGQVRWFELDLSTVMDLREAFFPASDRRLSIKASITELDWDWVDQVKNSAVAPPLFIAEDLLMYLEKSQVATILANLAVKFYGSVLLFDAISSLWPPQSSNLRWSIADIYQLHDWDICYQVLEVKTLKDFSDLHWQRLPLSAKVADSLPFFSTSYYLTKLGFAYGRTAQRLAQMC